MAKLTELASVIRSKNAGALLLTLDVIFDDDATYERVRDSAVISADTIARAYRVSHNEVQIIHFDIARAIKVTAADFLDAIGALATCGQMSSFGSI